jgi:cytochrome c peroxidase
MLRIVAVIMIGVGSASVTFAEMGGSEPVTPLEPAMQLDSRKVELGRKLFHDPRLSRANAIACVTCHDLQAGGDDGRPLSRSVDGAPLDFNTPTVFNVSGNSRLNWRGSFRTLEQQNESVLLNVRIMNTSWDELLAKLQADRDYPKEFAAVYQGRLAQDQVLDALATFQRSLLTLNARFDRHLRGERDAISSDELRGYQLFKSYGCVACHQGSNIGGNLFQPFGIFGDPFRQEGRSRPAESEDRERVFRVPSLRNVAVTAPYFHNGHTASLAEAVEIMARSQLGRELPGEDVQLIVQFLGTLTGEYQGRILRDRGSP